MVDDEPDVLSVTKLALKDIKIYGLSIKIHTAASKAEALELLNQPPFAIAGQAEGSLAVAFIDVVMESPQAGLELCEDIRHTLGNRSAQLFVRTGQPGIAPERAVVDEYDISGYFTKVEMTEQKLYTLVKSGVRQWVTLWYARLTAESTNYEIQHVDTREHLIEALDGMGEGFDDFGGTLVSGLVFDGKMFTHQKPDQVRQLHAELIQIDPVKTWPGGHQLIADGNRVMVKIEPTEDTIDYYYVSDGMMPLPEALHEMTFQNGLALAMLYKRAK
ncbi:MAG TPA: response regulator receiver protein [Anaerolineae bacterium]